jgi:hypothetical protein
MWGSVVSFYIWQDPTRKQDLGYIGACTPLPNGMLKREHMRKDHFSLALLYVRPNFCSATSMALIRAHIDKTEVEVMNGSEEKVQLLQIMAALSVCVYKTATRSKSMRWRIRRGEH